MPYREVDVIEVREILPAWLAAKDPQRVAEQAGLDRKTVRRYVDAAVVAGLNRDRGEDQLTDELRADRGAECESCSTTTA
jgi:hypothetical protein